MMHARMGIMRMMVFHQKVRIVLDRKLTEAHCAIFSSTLSMSLLVPLAMASIARVQLDKLFSYN